jgi:sn-glycerol 3-phosphate transport system ATP-binding protein
MSSIRLEQVSKFWGEKAAVDDASFTAAAGSFVVLLGPSGCGKSTTLRLIAGLDTPSAGRIVIDGRDVTQLAPRERRLSMVFQSYALFPHLDVRENILFGLKVRKERDQARRLARVAELLGLSALLDRKPSQLSGGQQQRVALGRAIIAETPVCLMDEPLSNLDAQLRQEMRREIRKLQQELGITMVYVTHDQVEAMSMADQVVLLRDGRIEQDAAPAALYAKPASVFAARFIGTPPMNIVDLARLPPDAARALAGGEGRGLLAGVRPEDIRLTTGPGVAAQVAAIEYLGADSIVTCTLGDESLVLRLQGAAGAAPGDAVHLAWDAEAVHHFDAATGARRDGAREARSAA